MTGAGSGRLKPGTVVAGKYEVVRWMGQGGMGSVYEACHAMIGRRFAIKCLHGRYAQDEEMLARFEREARAAGGLESENIVATVDFGWLDDEVPFLVMEYLDGENLRELLERTGPLSVPRAVDIVCQACRGAAAAHEQGIIHRDLKPENLFICRRGDDGDLVKLLDFGIAKLKLDVEITGSDAAMGTPCYMPLEQARGAKDVDARCDVYALGAILYEALSGRRPFTGQTSHEILYQMLSGPPPALGTLRPHLPAGLEDVVHQAMAREREDRFVSTTELATRLAPFAQLGAGAAPVDDVVDASCSTATSVALPVGLVVDEESSRGVSASRSRSPRTKPRVTIKPATRLLGLLGIAAVALAAAVFLPRPGALRVQRQSEPLVSAPSTVAVQAAPSTLGAPARSSHPPSSASMGAQGLPPVLASARGTARSGGRPPANGETERPLPPPRGSSQATPQEAEPAPTFPPPQDQRFDRTNPYAE